MSIRTILAPFTEDSDTPAVRMALAVARDLQSHVVGMYLEAPEQLAVAMPRGPAMAAGLGAGSFGMSTVRTELASIPDPIAELTRSRDQQAATVKAHFEQLCWEHEVPFLDADKPEHWSEHPLPSASYRRESGAPAQIIGQHAHAYDLLVAESASVAKAGKSALSAIETALLRAGRPVMLAPTQPPAHLDGRVLVAWNDSPQCWHALSTALPFMAKAKQVLLFHAGNDRLERLAEQKAAEYLAWHGIAAEVMQHEPGPTGVADYLMSQCGERQVGLMVMGAYSHSPLREKLLGGVTLTVLTNSAATPVLMMH
jgi:nucleotide-binding universal stress UspA family protein